MTVRRTTRSYKGLPGLAPELVRTTLRSVLTTGLRPGVLVILGQLALVLLALEGLAELTFGF